MSPLDNKVNFSWVLLILFINNFHGFTLSNPKVSLIFNAIPTYKLSIVIGKINCLMNNGNQYKAQFSEMDIIVCKNILAEQIRFRLG